MSRIMIRNAIVVTQDKGRKVIEDGAVYVEDKLIKDVGRTHKIEKRWDPEVVIDGEGYAVIPGLINAHTHSCQSIGRNLVTEMPILNWLRDVVGNISRNARAEDCYATTLAECLEMIKSGITFFVEYHRFPRFENSDAIAKAVVKAGIRAAIAPGFSDLGPSDFVVSKNQVRREIPRLVKAWHGKAEGKLQIWPSPGSPGFRESLDLCLLIGEIARRHNLRMTTHIAETLEQAVTFKNKHGMSQVEFLQETGMLGPHFLLAHMNWVNDRDIAIVSRIGASVAHNPFANMYFGEGVAPIPRMLDSNIRVALGTDSPSNGALDIFDVMKSCVLLHRIHHLNPEVIRPQHALDMATISGAEAVGMGGELGSIEVGKRADLVMIDLKALNLRPLHDVVSNIVMNGRADNVVSVILDGEFVLRDRKFIGIDEERVVHESESATARILDRLKYLEWFKKKHAKYRFSKS